MSAGNLLQGAQGRLQGHIHSVADGFRVVWHRVTSTLQEKGRWVTIIHSAKIHCKVMQKELELLQLRARADQNFRVMAPGRSSCVAVSP